MRLHLLSFLCIFGPLASAVVTYKVQKAANPTADQADAYQRIDAAMKAAVARYNKIATRPSKNITAQYVPSVQTADGNFNGNIRFGKDRSYMTERTALHETAHTLGVGQTKAFDQKCAANNWPTATKLLKTFDGADAKISCGGGHFWPYGLNYEKEWSQTNGDRHCQMVDAMLADGLAG